MSARLQLRSVLGETVLRRGGLALALLVVTCGTSAAQATASRGRAAANDGADGASRGDPLQLHGRLLLREGWRREAGVGTTAFDADDARLEARLRVGGWLRCVLEADAADGRWLKDAYARVRRGRFSLRVGQFKMPVSALEEGSRWDLPTAERGLVNEIVVDAMGIAGRRPGVEVGLERRGRWDVEARAGLYRSSHFRGERIGDEAFDNLNTDYSLGAQKSAVRLTFTRRRLSLGVAGEWRPARPIPGASYDHLWTTCADVIWSDRPKNGGRRVFADVFVGSSWQDDDAFDGKRATFVAGRLIGAWRHGGRQYGARFVEPFVGLSVFDASARVRADQMWEAVSGVNVGFWDRVRLTFEARHRRHAENVPLSLGIFAFDRAPEPPTGRTAVIVQLGGRF